MSSPQFASTVLGQALGKLAGSYSQLTVVFGIPPSRNANEDE